MCKDNGAASIRAVFTGIVFFYSLLHARDGAWGGYVKQGCFGTCKHICERHCWCHPRGILTALLLSTQSSVQNLVESFRLGPSDSKGTVAWNCLDDRRDFRDFLKKCRWLGFCSHFIKVITAFSKSQTLNFRTETIMIDITLLGIAHVCICQHSRGDWGRKV